MGTGKSLMKPFDKGNKKIAADGVAGSNADLSPCRGGIKKLGLAPFNKIHSRFHMAKEYFPLWRELYFFRAANEKHLVQLSFQSLDGLADSRLGNEQLLGSFRKA